MSKLFKDKLYLKVRKSILNNFEDNIDIIRFPSFKNQKENIQQKIVKYFRYNFFNFSEKIKPLIKLTQSELEGLNKVYHLLGEQKDKELLVNIIAYRLIGYKKIKLPLSSKEYWLGIEKIDKSSNKSEFIDLKFMNHQLYKHKIKEYDVNIFYTPQGIYTDFVIEQYAYKNDNILIHAQDGDTIIDAGGCWGDTALYFAAKVGKKGAVYTFEFIPSNIQIFNKNISINPTLKENIFLVENPVWEKSNLEIFYNDNGPGSSVTFEKTKNHDGISITKTIDDLVSENKLEKIDFIKMDIEGAEPYALKGAVETIKKFKPTLAIAIYHSIDDIINIPAWINSLNLGYKFYLGHYTIHKEETILFAKI